MSIRVSASKISTKAEHFTKSIDIAMVHWHNLLVKMNSVIIIKRLLTVKDRVKSCLYYDVDR